MKKAILLFIIVIALVISPITVVATPVDRTLYRGNSVSYVELLNLDNVFDSDNNEYVQVFYEVYQDKNKNGAIESGESNSDQLIAFISIDNKENKPHYNKGGESLTPLECASYLVETTVVSSKLGSEVVISEPFQIHVLQPTLIVQDSQVNYGVDIDISKDNIISLGYETACQCEDVSDVEDEQNRPSLTLQYTDEAGNIIKESGGENVGFQVQQDRNITAEILINNVKSEIKEDFNILLNRYDLSVHKIVDATEWAQYGQDVIVNVTQNGETYQVVFPKAELSSGEAITKKVIGLYAGAEIEVVEDTKWAWRCAPSYQYNGESINVFSATEDATITITNKINNKRWISVSEFIQNIFKINATGGN